MSLILKLILEWSISSPALSLATSVPIGGREGLFPRAGAPGGKHGTTGINSGRAAKVRHAAKFWAGIAYAARFIARQTMNGGH